MSFLSRFFGGQSKPGSTQNHYKPKGLQAMQKPAPADDEAKAAALYNLARRHLEEGRFAEAEKLQKQVLTITEKTQGPDHPAVAATLSALGINYIRAGRPAEAEAPFKRALAIYVKANGPAHPDAVLTLKNLGKLYCDLDRVADARELLDQAPPAVRELVLSGRR